MSEPDRCSSRSRGSIPTSCSRAGCRPASARTTSASIAARAAAAAVWSSSSASPTASCWCRATSRSDRAARTRSNASLSRTRSPSRSSGASRLPAESSGRVLVDATDFFLRDVVSAAASLRPGNYRVDRTRSAFYLPNTRNFPKNTEVDMTLTFVNEQTGGGGGGGGGPTQGPAPIGQTGGGGGGGGSAAACSRARLAA